jgi:hypothetical protein
MMSISTVNNGYTNYRGYTAASEDEDNGNNADNSSRFPDSSSDRPEGDKPAGEDNNGQAPAPEKNGAGQLPGAQTSPGTSRPVQTPVTAPGNTPSLRGATVEELKSLSGRYDADSSGGAAQSRNDNNNEIEKQKLNDARELDYTGYPPEVARFEKGLGDTQARLAALPPKVAQYYAAQLGVFDAAYRNVTSPEARAAIEQKVLELEDAILQEYNRANADPLDHALSVFNPPLGSGYLDASSSKELATLDRLRDDFLNARDAISREAIFRQASDLKNTLQHAVADATDAYVKKDRADWDDANKYVDKVIQDAEKIEDPVKRHKSISDALFSFNTGMGEDSTADKRVLAFTQHMRDDASLRHKLDTWQADAFRKLNTGSEYVPTSYTKILDDLPSAGPDYVRDLADKYTNVGKKTTDSEIAAAGGDPEKAKHLAARQKTEAAVMEGIIRFMLGLTPLAPLASYMFPKSGLSEEAILGIDIASGILSFLLDPINGIGSDAAKGVAKGVELAEDLGKDAVAAEEKQGGTALKLAEENGHITLERDADKVKSAEGEHGERQEAHWGARNLAPVKNDAGENADGRTVRYAPAQEGPSEDSRVLEAKARMNGRSLQIPEDYSLRLDPSTLKADENAPGVLTNDNGEHFIKNGADYYKVNYDASNNTWRALHPNSTARYTYPVRFDESTGAWSINTDVGLKGGGLGSRLVSLKRYASDPRIAKLIQSKTLKPQDPSTCFLDHGKVAKYAADVPDGRLKPITNGALTSAQLRKELDKGPIILSARGIARPDSNYSGMHTVVLLKVVREDGKERVLGIDLDDTIGRSANAQDPGNGDFGGVEYDIDDLTQHARPHVDEDTGAQLEMYQRPEEKGGFWSWWK